MAYRFAFPFFLAALIAGPVHAEAFEGSVLYRVTTVRAAPGEFSNLLLVLQDGSRSDRRGGDPAPMIMRHSQGDQWDLMIITAMSKSGGWTQPYSKLAAIPAPLLAFEEDVFAYGPPLDAIREAYDASGFFHIEMFDAAPGLADKLLEQRRMENRYLVATGQVPNMIFRRAAGSDVDVFTIGFHKSFESFASPAPATDDEKEKAATDAGFKNRADISFYLRSLISGHHDTLAVAID